jgi:ketosteroid isomerase-like protein
MTNRTPLEAVTRYIEAYNAGDDEGVLSVCDEAIWVIHHNRPEFGAKGRAALREVLRKSKGSLADKHFTDRRGLYVNGDTVIVEHTCKGKAMADIPGIAQRGDTVALDLCTRFTVRDGLIVEYHDYG